MSIFIDLEDQSDEEINNVINEESQISSVGTGIGQRKRLRTEYKESTNTKRTGDGQRCGDTNPRDNDSDSDNEFEKTWYIPEFSRNNMGRREDSDEPEAIPSTSRQESADREDVRIQEEDIRIPESGGESSGNIESKESFNQVLISAFQKIVPRRRILHDIYSRDTNRTRDGLLSRCMGVSYPGAVFIICSHGDHYHVIHDCSYSSSTCRCARIQTIKDGNHIRFRRRLICSNQFTIQHWRNLAEYCEKGERTMDYLYLSGRAWLQHSEGGYNTIRRSSDYGQKLLVENSNDSTIIPDFIKCGHETNEDGGVGSRSDQGNEEIGPKEGCKGDRIKIFIQKYPTSPLTHIFQTRHWSLGKYRYMPKNSPLLTTVMYNIGLEFNDMSIEDYIKYFEKCEPQNLIFNSPMGDINEYYYDKKQSIYVMEELLLHQFHDNKDAIRIFLKDVYNVCNKKIAKKNTLFVLSPPNAGKNFFFDAVIHFFLNFGQLGNFNKYNLFPMQECVNRRIILWNEPVLETSATETLKTLFGGDTTNAKVKYQNDAIVTRTPIIVLSNNDVFPKDLAFRTRMITYKWRTCSNLRLCKKKPWPMAFYGLLEKYGILEEETTDTEVEGFDNYWDE